jgi:hypothetical protein
VIETSSADEATIRVSMHGVTRFDVYVDSRPIKTIDVSGVTTLISLIPVPAAKRRLEICALEGVTLVRKLSREPLSDSLPAVKSKWKLACDDRRADSCAVCRRMTIEHERRNGESMLD